MSFFLDDEETLDEPYGEIWRHLDLSPERIAERERRRETAGHPELPRFIPASVPG